MARTAEYMRRTVEEASSARQNVDQALYVGPGHRDDTARRAERRRGRPDNLPVTVEGPRPLGCSMLNPVTWEYDLVARSSHRQGPLAPARTRRGARRRAPARAAGSASVGLDDRKAGEGFRIDCPVRHVPVPGVACELELQRPSRHALQVVR